MKRKRLLGGLLALLMLFNIGSAFPMGVWGDDPPTLATDRTSLFNSAAVIVRQGTSDLDVGDPIDFTKPIILAFDIEVPSHSDPDTGNPVFDIGLNDYFKFDISETLSMPPTSPIDLTADLDGESIRIARAYFTKDSVTGMLSVTVVFDNPAVFASPTDYYEAAVALNATLTFNGDDIKDVDEGDTIEILSKTYKRDVAERTYTIEKSLVNPADGNQEIEWQVKVTGTKVGSFNDPSASLVGLLFSDTLTANAGSYVDNSFLISSDGTAFSSATPTYDSGSRKLSYTFVDPAQSPQYIHFKTKTANTIFINGGNVTNNAKLTGTGVNKTSNTVTKTYPNRTWITKESTNSGAESGTYDPTNRTITWTITVNQPGAILNGVKITDTPPALDFVSAEWSGGGIPNESWSGYPAGGVYEIGNITAPGTLTIVQRVPDPSSGTSIGTTTYTNTAKLTVGTQDYKTVSKNEVVGYAGFTKSAADANLQNGTIKWTVNFNPRGQILENIKIYDLFVYGDSIADLNSLTKPTALTSDIPSFTFTGLGLTQNTKQKLNGYSDFQPATITGGDYKIYTLTDSSSNPVADLLVISLPDQAASGTNNYSFSFTSKVMDPTIYAINNPSDFKMSNTAHFFSTQSVTQATASTDYRGSTLIKDGDPFNYVDKTITYQILVNKNKIDFNTINDGSPLSPLTLTDTIDAGWEFIGGFKLYNVTGSDTMGSEITDPSPIVSMGTPGTDGDGKTTVTFTFNNTSTYLDKAYCIVLTAQPTAAKAQEIFSKNQSITVNNKAEFFWAGTKLSEDGHNTNITSTILDKTYDLSKANDDGEITWTIDYNPYSSPYNLGTTGETIKDTFSPGLDLPTDSFGNLDMDKIHVYPLTLQANGTLSQGSPIAPDSYISYDKAARTLTFNIPDPDQAYRLTYVTDITGSSGELLKNEAKLISGKNDGAPEKIEYTVTDQAASATIKKGGSLIIDKQDNVGGPLQGAEFTLYASDDTTIVRRGFTNTSGELAFRAIPEGNYFLRETQVPHGYEPPAFPIRTYAVVVSKEGTVMVTKIDGDDTAPGSKMSVTNYLYGTTGSLLVTKAASGYYPAGAGKSFSFKVELVNSGTGMPLAGTYHYVGYEGAASGDISHNGTFSLKDGQYVAILDLPVGTDYTLTELNDPAEYIETTYTINSSVSPGTSATDYIYAGQNRITFTNVRDTGHLTLAKVTKGHFTDSGKKFKFTLNLKEKNTNNPLGGSYNYDGSYSGTITGGSAEFNLSNGESVTVRHLPEGAKFSIDEDDYSSEYVETSNDSGTGLNASGSILGSEDTKAVTFTNTRDTGHLKLAKVTEGYFPVSASDFSHDTYKKFGFTLRLTEKDGITSHFGNYDYTITSPPGSPDGTITGTITSNITAFNLHGGQYVTINHLPKDIKFTIAEDDYSGQYVETTYTIDGLPGTDPAAAGAIPGDEETREVTFTNKRITGDLIFSKTTAGYFPDPGKVFDFTLKLTDEGSGLDLTGTYAYSITGEPSGTLSGGTTDFHLTDGQSVTIKNLPKNARFTITEADYSSEYTETSYNLDGVDTSSAVAAGTIGTGRTVAFTNTRETGHLALAKTVVGNLRDPHQKFKFTLNFTESDGTTPHSGSYSYIASGTADDTMIIPGSTITLPAGGSTAGTLTIPADGEIVIELEKDQALGIQNIPKDIKYTITEDDYKTDRITTANTIDGISSPDGLIADSSIEAGTGVNSVIFTNTRRPGTAPTDPVTPTTPVTPTAPTTGPTGPTIPTVPTEPTIPTGPTEPTEPTEVTDPTEPTETTQPQPTYPSIPVDEVEDPNDPDSPDDFILIDENGTPQGRYTKTPQPDGSYVYLDENGIPLGQRRVPRTGDQSNLILWAIMLTLSLGGAAWLLLPQLSIGRRKH